MSVNICNLFHFCLQMTRPYVTSPDTQTVCCRRQVSAYRGRHPLILRHWQLTTIHPSAGLQLHQLREYVVHTCHMHIRACTNTHVHLYVYVYMCVCVCVSARMRACVHPCMRACVGMRMHIFMYACIYGKWVYLIQVSSILDFWSMNNDPNALATENRWRMWTLNFWWLISQFNPFGCRVYL